MTAKHHAAKATAASKGETGDKASETALGAPFEATTGETTLDAVFAAVDAERGRCVDCVVMATQRFENFARSRSLQDVAEAALFLIEHGCTPATAPTFAEREAWLAAEEAKHNAADPPGSESDPLHT